jgi:quercetin dioxygenase-like cupin family protein
MEAMDMRLATSAALLLMFAASAPAQVPSGSLATWPAEPRWRPAPPPFPPGALIAVLHGDPGAAVTFTVRLRLPDGYRLAPHTHPTDEHVTVIRGSFRVGTGTTVDERRMTALGAGDFLTLRANEPHYAVADGVTVVQIHAVGPSALRYVNGHDAARTTASR